MTEPVGVILAAGLASRMGRPKQLLPYREGTVLGAVVSAARSSQLSRIAVVLGAYVDEIRHGLDLSEVTVVINPDPERGNLSSLQAAARQYLRSPLLLLMGDMPGIAPDVINDHLHANRLEPTWLRATKYTDGIGHPLMLSPELVAGLDDLAGPKPLWSLLHDERAAVLDVAAAMPVDVDTPEDYGEALARDPAE